MKTILICLAGVVLFGCARDESMECVRSHVEQQSVAIPLLTGFDSNNLPTYTNIYQAQDVSVCDEWVKTR